jgi:resuscitation-promoting factor RpfA
MRLVCPNCEAKYEVPEDAIPDTGRDVQCANCGHSWFQMRQRPAAAVQDAPLSTAAEDIAAERSPETVIEPAAEAAPEVMAAPAAEPDVVPEAVAEPEMLPDAPPAEVAAAADTPVHDTPDGAAPNDDGMPVADMVAEDATVAVAEAAPETLAGAEPDSAAEPVVVTFDPDTVAAEPVDPPATADAVAEEEPEPDTNAPDTTAPDAAVPLATTAYAVDESVLAILREEAEREAQARRAEARPLESQTDLGLDSAMPDRQKPALVASDGALLDGDGDAALKPSARRDLLPDVEEINSTLRPSEVQSDRTDGQPLPPMREGMGFRSGFLMVMTLAIIGAVIYIMAPRLTGMAPALEGPMTAYVGAVDGLRLSLDGLMRSATVAINGE